MLTLTRKTEYGLIAVCHLAQVGDKVVSARDIAGEHNVPLPLLMNVLKRLNRTGYVRSVRGAHGGYVLAVAPEQFSLADLIEAVEGPVHLVRCVNSSKGARKCDLSGECFIRHSVVKTPRTPARGARGLLQQHPAAALTDRQPSPLGSCLLDCSDACSHSLHVDARRITKVAG